MEKTKKKLCNPNTSSYFAFLRHTILHIDHYQPSIHGSAPIKCSNGHELVAIQGEHPIFRHKHATDVGGSPMTNWHLEWQSHFPVCERHFPKKNSDQKTSRYADAVLNSYNLVVEIQHSFVSKSEVDARKHDYAIHGQEIVWIVHGNNSVRIKELPTSKRVYVEFVSDTWKYESFLSYDAIYLDIADKIYKIFPKTIKSHMLDVEYPKSKAEFLRALKGGSLASLWKDTEPIQCRLVLKQQGAGNGKTYGIIQMLESEEMSHYKHFLFVTKQHSAKYVIYSELKKQVSKGQLKHLRIESEREVHKKYILTCKTDRSAEPIQIILATIDSLMFSIGNKDHTEFDMFQGIVNSIIDEHIHAEVDGKIRFGGTQPKLNKETLLVLDEAQDLSENYAKAILQIMKNKYVDAYIVGDRLQSISYEHNAFTYCFEHEFPSIRTEKRKATNLCRRFHHPELVQFVNATTPFEKYGLPPVTPFVEDTKEEDEDEEEEEEKEEEHKHTDSPIVFFEGLEFSYEDKESRMNKEIESIMKYFEQEVEERVRKPSDFLIVTPFTSHNPLVDALQLSINMYWKGRIGSNTEEYVRYAIFHKSEEGTSIDLDDSKDATRLVSIHSSKGDGRPVVFLIGFTEEALKRFSVKKDTLLYDSLFHVATTRMMERLYIRYENNNDALSVKLNQYIYANSTTIHTKPNFWFFNSVKYAEAIAWCNHRYFEEFHTTFVQAADISPLQEKKGEKRIIDMVNHSIRYASLLIQILCEILAKELVQRDHFDFGLKQQIRARWWEILESPVYSAYTWKIYNAYISNRDLALIRLSDKGRDYQQYFMVLLETMKHIQAKLRDFFMRNVMPQFCPLECIVFHHMLEIKKNGNFTDTYISDIYNIVDIYSNSFHPDMMGHETCLCKQHFRGAEGGFRNKKVEKMKKYLQHFEQIKIVKQSMARFHELYQKVNWLHGHVIKFQGVNANYKVWKQFPLIGYDSEQCYLAYVKPQFSSLNFNEIIMTSIYDTFLLQNIQKYGNDEEVKENYKRFHGKKCITCVFSLDYDEPYTLDWTVNGVDLIQTNEEFLRFTLFEYMKEKFAPENNGVYYFYRYWRAHCPPTEQKPADFIRFLKDSYTKMKVRYEEKFGRGSRSFPVYVDEFFTCLQSKIDLCPDRKKKKEILESLEDREFFLREIGEWMESSLRRYLNIRTRDSESEEE